MAQTPERKVKAQVADILKEYGVYYFFPPANGLGRAGIPDIIACAWGQYLAIECKAGKGKPTELQLRELRAIRNANGIAFIVNETNVEALHLLLLSLNDFAMETQITQEKANDKTPTKKTTAPRSRRAS